MSDRVLIAPVGWEERFEEGVYIDISEFKPTKLILPYSQAYEERTLPFRTRIKERADSLNIQCIESEHDYCDAVTLYTSLLTLLSSHISSTTNVRLNATTAPRDLIWYSLQYLSENAVSTEFSYFRPLDYDKTYLSRDAKAPRLILKRSGIAFPDRPTCILALAGYDNERLSQLQHRYEPKIMLIGRQTGNQLKNEDRNIALNRESTEVKWYFDIDCYDTSDSSVSILRDQLDKLNEPHNIIAASLGPKPCALTLFKLTQLMPDIGLVYIPAGDYSPDYSTGINRSDSQRTLAAIDWT